MSARLLSVTGIDAQDHIVLAAITDEGQSLDPAAAMRLFELPVSVGKAASDPTDLGEALNAQFSAILAKLDAQRADWLQQEMDKRASCFFARIEAYASSPMPNCNLNRSGSATTRSMPSNPLRRDSGPPALSPITRHGRKMLFQDLNPRIHWCVAQIRNRPRGDAECEQQRSKQGG